MRQAVTNMVVGLCLVLAAPTRGDGPPAGSEPPIARARRLIQAGDRATALGILEDALIDGPAADRPAIIDLLRRSYEALAREAEAAGRTGDAAHYRDNLAILEQAREAARSAPPAGPRVETPRPSIEPSKPHLEPPKPRVEPDRPPVASPKSRIRPTPVPAAPKASLAPGRPVSPAPESIPEAPKAVVPPPPSGPPDLRAPVPDPGLSEPSPLPEPSNLPMPGPMPSPRGATGGAMTQVPRLERPVDAGQVGTREIPLTRPAATDPSQDVDQRPSAGGGEELINPGEATAEARPVRPGDGGQSPLAGIRKTQPAATPPQAGTAADPSGLAEADRLFKAQRFDESGRIYAALAARNQLPADRRPHWAYCRFQAVVRRINAGPRSAREWDAIEAEVRSIQRLTPGNWYAEYLINKIAEVRRSRRRPGTAPNKLVVRGSAPEDASSPTGQPPQAQAPARRRPGLFGRSREAPAAPAQPAAPAADRPVSPAEDQSLNLPGGLSRTGPEDTPGTGPILAINAEGDAGAHAGDEKASPAPAASDGGETKPRNEDASRLPGPTGSNESNDISWQIHETPNFRIYHCDPALAERAAAVAESVRTAQAKRWGSTATRTPWSSRCDLYLYPTAKSYAEATGQPETSPGISTMSNNGVRVLSRRMSLRADNPLLLTTTLPHEVTHIVLADLFVAQPIPRWADEGLAVLAEPAAEQHHRQADLKDPLDARRTFQVGQLMTMDYPDPRDWRLFYAQSVSLTLFLVEQGPPERFIQFVRDSQRIGAEAALRDIYHIEGLAALQERWLDYARKRVAVDVASSRDAEAAPGDTRRD